MILLWSTRADNDPDSGYPRGGGIEHVQLIGNYPTGPNQYGILMKGAALRVQHVRISHLYTAIGSDWSVNNTVRDAVLTFNKHGIYLTAVITTTRFESVVIAGSFGTAVTLQNNVGGVTFRDTIIEQSAWFGVDLSRAAKPVKFIDCWFELNQHGDFYDPYAKAIIVRKEVG
jgi:hypothetical protein